MQAFFMPAICDVNLNRLLHTIQSCCLKKEPTKEDKDRFSVVSNDNPEHKTMLYEHRPLGTIRLEVDARLVSCWIFIPHR